MRISIEPNFKRLFHRVTVPLTVQIDGTTHHAADWSVGGFRVEDYEGDMGVGREFEAAVYLPYRDFAVHIPMRAKVVRRDGRTLACAFVELTAAQKGALHYLVDAAMEGRSGDLGETLGTLRAPPISNGEKKLVEDHATTDGQVAQMRLFSKTAVFVSVVGCVAAVLLGSIFYLNSRVRVPDAVIIGQLVHAAPVTPGRLSGVFVTEGQQVEAGTPLFEMDDPEMRAALAGAQTRLTTSEAEATAAGSRLDEEQARLRLYGEIIPLQIKRTEAAIRQTEARLRTARSELGRVEKLFEDKIGSQADLERAQTEVESFEAVREEQTGALELLKLNQSALARGLYFDGKDIQGRTRELESLLAAGRDRVAEARQEVAHAQERVARLTVRAPAGGTVFAVPLKSGEYASAQLAPVAIDTGRDHFAVANIAADDAVKITPGARARVWIPTRNLELAGVVTQVGALPTTSHQSGASGPVAGVVPVKLQLEGAPSDLPSGLRAVVRLHVNPFVKVRSL